MIGEERARFYAWTRITSGLHPSHHAYVKDRVTGRVVMSCPHKHRGESRAVTCSERMLSEIQAATAAAYERGVAEERERCEAVLNKAGYYDSADLIRARTHDPRDCHFLEEAAPAATRTPSPACETAREEE